MKKLYLKLALLLITFPSFSQQDRSPGVYENKLRAFYKNNYQEQIYIQTDKRAYITGERVYFKVFCLEKTTSKASKLSKVAYFEILSDDNKQLIKAKIELKNGSGHGQVFIPTNINSGNFVMRGYTRWMQNYGPESFFHNMITIINPFKKLGLNPLSKPDDITINFYPETGDPINGLQTKVIFDCRYANGHPAKVQGILFANDTTEVVRFSPDQNGYGNFEYTPDIFNKYQVALLHADSTVTTHKVPMTIGKGLALQVDESKKDFTIDIYCNDQLILESSDRIITILQQEDVMVLNKDLKLLNGKTSFTFDKTLLNDGVANLYLFSEGGDLLKTRSILKIEEKNEELISLTNSTYVTREGVKLSLDNKFDDFMDCSIAAGSFHDNFKGQYLSLTNYLLIDHALKGFIYGIETYFEGDIESISSSINDLLIAFPEEKTDWLSAVEDKVFIPEYRGAIITGQVVHKVTKEPTYGIYAYISTPGKNVQFNATQSKHDGQLIFEMNKFYGSNDVIIQTDYTKDTMYTIHIDNPFSEKYLEYNLPEINVDESMQTWIEQRSYNMQISNTYQKYETKLPPLTVIDTTTFYNDPDATYFLDDFTRFIVMEEVLREYVNGTNVRKNKEGFYLRMLDLERNDVFTENPLMLLDGVAVFDANEIIALDPLKIEKIETVKRRFHKGYLDCHGILNLTSYDGNLPGYKLNENAVIIEYDGLQFSRQYKFPEYLKPKDKRSTYPDFRNTLYWNPDYKSDDNSETIAEFYTSDAIDKYEVIINGISKNGLPFSKKTYFKIHPSKNN